jgi:hypothetical protein
MSNDSERETAVARTRAVKDTYQDTLLTLPNVVGVGIGMQQKGGRPTGEVALVVMVSRKVDAASLAEKDVIPAEIEGVPVDVQEVGTIRAQ